MRLDRFAVLAWLGPALVVAGAFAFSREEYDLGLGCFVLAPVSGVVAAWVGGRRGRRLAMWANILLVAACAGVAGYPLILSLPRFWDDETICGHHPKLEEAHIGGGHAHVCPQWYLMTMNLGAMAATLAWGKEHLQQDRDGDGIGEYGPAKELFPIYAAVNRRSYTDYARRSEGKNKNLLFPVGLVPTSRDDVWEVYEDHFSRPNYYVRFYVPEDVNEAERHWAAVLWPIRCSRYVNWAFLIDETGFYRTEDCHERLEGGPALQSAYFGAPFTSEVRWTRLTRRFIDNYGPDERYCSKATPSHGFGGAVAFDGETIAVGAYARCSNAGFARVFSRDDGFASHVDLRPKESIPWSKFGYSVALDGEALVVGAPGERFHGSATVFERAHGRWTEAQKLTPPNPERSDWFGASVAIAGSVIAVGAPGRNGMGAAYLYERSRRWELAATVRGSSTRSGSSFGAVVAVDGTRIAVGAPGEAGDVGEQRTGAAYVFARVDGRWTEQARLEPGEDEGAHFGTSVALEGDTLAARALEFTNIYRAVANGWGWMKEAARRPKLRGSTILSLTGGMLLAGAPSLWRGGRVWVYRRSGGEWVEAPGIEAPKDGADGFGISVAARGNTAIVGAWDRASPRHDGAAFRFEYEGGKWTQKQAMR